MRDVIRYSKAFKARLAGEAASGKYRSLDEAGRLICLFLILSPQSGIVLGRQSTALRRHCAPEGEAQPPQGGALPACR
ncbi:MAG: hypothetical protein LBL31_02885 [Spirochaetaceae bacterium]|nr:hypothetical protein [Spirochaetaceae bacterium]